MAILTKDEAQALMKKVLSYSKADECEVNLNGTERGNIRYARNSVSTSGKVSQTQLAVPRGTGGGRARTPEARAPIWYDRLSAPS